MSADKSWSLKTRLIMVEMYIEVVCTYVYREWVLETMILDKSLD